MNPADIPSMRSVIQSDTQVAHHSTRTTRKKRDALAAGVVHVGVPVVVTMFEAITDQTARSRLLSILNLRPDNAGHVSAKLWLLRIEVTVNGGSG